VTATVARSAELDERKPLGQLLVRVMTTTDHKVIGNLYFVTAMAWFVAAGVVTTENETVSTVGFIVFVVWAIWVAGLSVQLYRTPE